MEPHPPASAERVFLIRLWADDGPEPRDWRGSVTDAASGRRRYVLRLDDLCELIRAALADGEITGPE